MEQGLDLSAKKILITGASSGIGKETAILCSSLGAKVIMIARNEERLKDTLSLLEGTGHSYYVFDLVNVDNIENKMKEIVRAEGAFDGFVHSAGIDHMCPLRMMKLKVLNELMSINYYSFVEIVRYLTRRNSYSDGMSIVGLSSLSSQRGAASKTAYCASKAALDASVRCMANELSKKNIRVNSVVPALVNTGLYEKVKDMAGDSDEFSSLAKRQYAGLGKPSDIAYLIAFLLSDCSKQITGANLDISGGVLST